MTQYSNPIITHIDYTYKKTNSEIWVLNIDDIPVDSTRVHDRQIVRLGPLSIAGNHKHPRTEWFIGLGDLIFIWRDESGNRHEEHMNPDNRLKVIEVPPWLPHAVTNRSPTTFGLIYEMADRKMTEVQPMVVYGGHNEHVS